MIPRNIVHPRAAYLAQAFSWEGVLEDRINERRSSNVARGYNEYAFSWVIKFMTHADISSHVSHLRYAFDSDENTH